MIDFGEGKVATLHPGCIEMPSDQDDKLTVNTNCLKAAARGDQAAVEAFLTGQCGHLIGLCTSVLSLVTVYSTGSYSSSEFVVIPDNSTLVTCLHHAACKVSVILPQ